MAHRAVHLLTSFVVAGALSACALVPTPDPTPDPPTTATAPATTSTVTTTSTTTSSTTTAPPTTSTIATTSTTTSAPPTPTAPIGLIAFGDAGSGDATQTQVAATMSTWASTHRGDALLEAGDVVYPDGSPSKFAATIDQPYAALLAKAPLWVALGNHDVTTNNGNDLVAHLGLPGHTYEKVLSRAGVSVQILVLDSTDVSAAQTAWLTTRLETGSYRWRIVMFHHPVWSCSTHGSTRTIIDSWLPIIESHHVDLVLTGHDHNYQRFADASTTVVVTGGGGMPTYPVGACTDTPALLASAQRHHFLGIEATDSSLSVTAVARTGENLDHFVIN
jgi:hypothetical protein